MEQQETIYCFNNKDLFDHIDSLQCENAQHEYYLTDMVKILSSLGKKVNGLVIEDRDEVMGINDCIELYHAYAWMRYSECGSTTFFRLLQSLKA